MVLRQFPDINVVRQLRNDATRPGNTWQNVALNIRCKEVSRTGVESPYSLFLNKKGFSYCSVNKQQYRIETDKFLLTQPGETYGLVVDNPGQTEICNIHINRDFFNGWAHTMTVADEQQLDMPVTITDAAPRFFTQLYRVDEKLEWRTDQLRCIAPEDKQSFDIITGCIVQHLLLSNNEKEQNSKATLLKGCCKGGHLQAPGTGL